MFILFETGSLGWSRVSRIGVPTDRTCFGKGSGMKSFQTVETQNPPMVNHVRKHSARIAVGTNMSTHVVGTSCMIKVNGVEVVVDGCL